MDISIHAPRAGSDNPTMFPVCNPKHFNPRSPCGERHRLSHINRLPIPISIHAPRAGSDFLVGYRLAGGVISIHAPRAGSDFLVGYRIAGGVISIHAPRAGSDWRPRPATPATPSNFNPRSPCGERRPACPRPSGCGSISIHAPRAGSDRTYRSHLNKKRRFQSTLPVRGATFSLSNSVTIFWHFNPRSPCGERQRRCPKRNRLF